MLKEQNPLFINSLSKANKQSISSYTSTHFSLLSPRPKNSWQPVRTGDTTASSYWLNWRFLICSICVLMSMVFSSFLISKYEGPRSLRHGAREPSGILYYDEVWRPCLKGVHPGWLLAYRVVAFFVLLILLILTIAVDGGSILYFYTEWTFALITIYFGLGTLLSVYGCYQYHYEVGGDKIANDDLDAEQGTTNSNMSKIEKSSGPNEEHQTRQIAGFWGYAFQIIFQMNAGAVILTDCVFWFIIVPFLAIKDYDLNFLIINMHSINVVFLLGDTALNSLHFPWFRIAYFFLWTDVFVIFQWIVHACVSIWWPYPFLDLSSPFSPLWYSLVALLHIPCYGIFALVMKLKHFLYSKWFPQSYRHAPRESDR